MASSARLVQATVCDEAGQLVFTEADIPRLNDLPLYLIEPLVDAAIRINKIGPGDSEAIRKN